MESDLRIKPSGPVENAVARMQRHLAENGEEAHDELVCYPVSVWVHLMTCLKCRMPQSYAGVT